MGRSLHKQTSPGSVKIFDQPFLHLTKNIQINKWIKQLISRVTENLLSAKLFTWVLESTSDQRDKWALLALPTEGTAASASDVSTAEWEANLNSCEVLQEFLPAGGTQSMEG